jgi:hypothetical protein
LQNKGWAYHRLPADAAFTFLFAYWLIVIIASSPAHQTKAASFAIAGTAVALGFLGATILEKQKTDIEHVAHYDDSAERWLTRLIQRHGARSIMAFSQMLSPPFPVVNDTGIRWTSRFGSMWALKAEESAPRRKGPSIRQQVIDDFVASRPDLVLVSDADNFDYLEKLGRDATFEEIWRRYVFLEGAQGMRVFGSPELAKSLAEPIR